MADDELDNLYRARPEEFTALRTELAAAAKKRGDAERAKRISDARKPTTAAWIVNVLALQNTDATRRLSELGDQLRQAHAAMDGERIRELSAGQRRLVDEVARIGFDEADIAGPSAALRDDVTGTLQAAIADPDVAGRLGRLTKAERWSGFGEFGYTAMVSTTARKTKAKATAEPAPVQRKADDGAAEKARAAVAAAERVKADADEAVAELQADLATARLRHDDARRRLQDSERGLAAAQDAYDKAKQTARDAAAAVKEAKAQVKSVGTK